MPSPPSGATELSNILTINYNSFAIYFGIVLFSCCIYWALLVIDKNISFIVTTRISIIQHIMIHWLGLKPYMDATLKRKKTYWYLRLIFLCWCQCLYSILNFYLTETLSRSWPTFAWHSALSRWLSTLRSPGRSVEEAPWHCFGIIETKLSIFQCNCKKCWCLVFTPGTLHPVLTQIFVAGRGPMSATPLKVIL